MLYKCLPCFFWGSVCQSVQCCRGWYSDCWPNCYEIWYDYSWSSKFGDTHNLSLSGQIFPFYQLLVQCFSKMNGWICMKLRVPEEWPHYYPVLSNCVCGGSIPPSSCTHVLYTSVLRQDTEPQMFQVIRPTPSMVCERVCEWVRGRLNISAIVHECSPLPFSYTLRPKCPLDTKHIQVKWMNCHEMNEHILRSRQWASCKNQSGADLFRSGVSVLAWKKFMSGPVPHVQTACLYSKTHLFDLSEWIWSLNKTLKFIK